MGEEFLGEGRERRAYYIPPGHLSLPAAVERLSDAWSKVDRELHVLTDEEREYLKGPSGSCDDPRSRALRERRDAYNKAAKEALNAARWRLRDLLYEKRVRAFIKNEFADAGLEPVPPAFWISESATKTMATGLFAVGYSYSAVLLLESEIDGLVRPPVPKLGPGEGLSAGSWDLDQALLWVALRDEAITAEERWFSYRIRHHHTADWVVAPSDAEARLLADLRLGRVHARRDLEAVEPVWFHEAVYHHSSEPWHVEFWRESLHGHRFATEGGNAIIKYPLEKLSPRFDPRELARVYPPTQKNAFSNDREGRLFEDTPESLGSSRWNFWNDTWVWLIRRDPDTDSVKAGSKAEAALFDAYQKERLTAYGYESGDELELKPIPPLQWPGLHICTLSGQPERDREANGPRPYGEATRGQYGGTAWVGVCFDKRAVLDHFAPVPITPLVPNGSAVVARARERRGQRTKVNAALKECFPQGVPGPDKMTNGEIVKIVGDAMGEAAPSEKTILRAAGRQK